MAMTDRDKACVEAFKDECAYRLRWLASDLFEHDSSFRLQIMDTISTAVYRAVYDAELKRIGIGDDNGN
jgi:hypothetical protein